MQVRRFLGSRHRWHRQHFWGLRRLGCQTIIDLTAESGFSNSDALAGPTAPRLGALAQQPEGSPSVPASSTTAAAVARHRRVIVNYNPAREPERGYLSVDEGSVVVAMPDSQAAAGLGSMFACDYVFAWDENWRRGWLPVEVLGCEIDTR